MNGKWLGPNGSTTPGTTRLAPPSSCGTPKDLCVLAGSKRSFGVPQDDPWQGYSVHSEAQVGVPIRHSELGIRHSAEGGSSCVVDDLHSIPMLLVALNEFLVQLSHLVRVMGGRVVEDDGQADVVGIIHHFPRRH